MERESSYGVRNLFETAQVAVGGSRGGKNKNEFHSVTARFEASSTRIRSTRARHKKRLVKKSALVSRNDVRALASCEARF